MATQTAPRPRPSPPPNCDRLWSTTPGTMPCRSSTGPTPWASIASPRRHSPRAEPAASARTAIGAAAAETPADRLRTCIACIRWKLRSAPESRRRRSMRDGHKPLPPKGSGRPSRKPDRPAWPVGLWQKDRDHRAGPDGPRRAGGALTSTACRHRGVAQPVYPSRQRPAGAMCCRQRTATVTHHAGSALRRSGLAETYIAIGSVDAEKTDIAAKAYRRRGKGHHPAGLNRWDMLACAFARQRGAPLVFNASDFVQTDVESAVGPRSG